MVTSYLKNELNPIFFDSNKKLREPIREKLLLIARKAFEDLEIKTDILDVTFTGSLANFTYNEDSDVDLHIVLKFNNVNKDKELVKKALDCNKFVWNLRHEITFAGHEVEIYFQDVSEEHSSSGVYSVEKNKWLVEPKKLSSQIDRDLVEKKYNHYSSHIESLERIIKKDITKDYAEKILNNAQKYFKKLKADRKESLESEGELSVNNLVFKELRRKGFIDRLNNLMHQAYDKSLTESYFSKIATNVGYKKKNNTFKSMKQKKKETKMFFKINPGTRKRHQHPIGRTGYDRKNPQFVPDMHKADLRSFQKLENLRNGKTGRYVLSPSEFSKLKKLYSINLVKPGEIKKLGNTGINLYFDPNFNKFVMERL